MNSQASNERASQWVSIKQRARKQILKKKMAIGLMLTYKMQCWLLKMDQKLCLQHDLGCPYHPLKKSLIV